MLTFYNLAITLRTATFKIPQLFMLLTLCLCVLYGSHNKQQLLPQKLLANWLCIMEAQSFHSAVRPEYLCKTDAFNLSTPNDPHMGRIAPLPPYVTFYIFIQQIYVRKILNMLLSIRFSLQNALCSIMPTCLFPVLFTFYIQGC